MLKLYASWGLDFLKVDCISDHPYRPPRFARSPRPSTKPAGPSCSAFRPAPLQLEHAAEVAKYAQMWRISNDHWDGWTFPNKPNG